MKTFIEKSLKKPLPTLILTVGLPRGGKSTWCKTKDYPIVNPDLIRLALHGRPFIADAEPMVWAIAKVMVKYFFLEGHDIVILDSTSTTRKRRDEWKSKDWTREYHVINTNKEICKERAEKSVVDHEHLQGLLGAIDRTSDNWESVEKEEWS